MEWSARVEWSTPEKYSLDDIDELITALEGYHVAIGSEKVPDGVDETWSATITFDAEGTLPAAITRALQLVEAATGREAAGVEVLVTAVRDHCLENPTEWRW